MDKIIAHRGASAYAPENTFAAFERAYILGCRMLEFDVMLSADGEPFVIHDQLLKRTTNEQGAVSSTDADALRAFDAGSWFAREFYGEKIPHLHDVIQWLNFTDMQANIEIKSNAEASQQTCIAVLSAINQFWPTEKKLPLLSSFNLDVLRLCRTLAPEMPLGLVLDVWTDQWLDLASELNCYSIHVHKSCVTQARIKLIKEEGYKVYVFTVNRARNARRLLRWGADAIFSDYPDLI